MGKMSIEDMNMCVRKVLSDHAAFGGLISEVDEAITKSMDNGWYEYLDNKVNARLEVNILVSDKWEEGNVRRAIYTIAGNKGYLLGTVFKNNNHNRRHVMSKKSLARGVVYTFTIFKGANVKYPDNGDRLYKTTLRVICKDVTKLLYDLICEHNATIKRFAGTESDKAFLASSFIKLNFNDNVVRPTIVVDRTDKAVIQYLVSNVVPVGEYSVEFKGMLIKDRYYYDVKIIRD